ncbi:unnamed protein product [Scytosiphon promiscuus]
MTTTLLVGSSPDALATELIARIGKIAKESVRTRGVFNVTVSGGSMPKILSNLARSDGVDWSKTKIYFADERCVPLDHGDSNYKAWDNLFASSGIPRENVIAVRTDLSPEEAAADYEAKLKQGFPPSIADGAEGDGAGGDAKDGASSTSSPPQHSFPSFDAALLGVGPDGHTCSLFPSHPLLEENSKWVAHIEDSPKPPPQRITLTYPVLNNSRNVWSMRFSVAAVVVRICMRACLCKSFQTRGCTLKGLAQGHWRRHCLEIALDRGRRTTPTTSSSRSMYPTSPYSITVIEECIRMRRKIPADPSSVSYLRTRVGTRNLGGGLISLIGDRYRPKRVIPLRFACRYGQTFLAL